MSSPNSKVIEYGTNDILWCDEHGRYEQFSSLTTVDPVTDEQATTVQISHRPVPINPETGLP